MAEISAKDVQKLRQMAGAGMMEAKRALVDTDGDFDKALEILRAKGVAKAAKRAVEREATDGTIGHYLHFQADRPVTGVVVELACETDFVAKHPDFRQTADDIALHVAWGKPPWVQRKDIDPAVLESQRDLFTRQAKEQGKPDPIVAKIVEGKLNAFFEDKVLYDQRFVNEQKFEGTVGEMVNQLAARMGENISVRRVAWLTVGEDVS
ncbi:MAG TPA: elongation factor Ts [Acidimicrobiia bacterium]|jgi:elongation factor Ts|nr:elongation factor Ts [Acidimicrobiia bacterium]